MLHRFTIIQLTNLRTTSKMLLVHSLQRFSGWALLASPISTLTLLDSVQVARDVVVDPWPGGNFCVQTPPYVRWCHWEFTLYHRRCKTISSSAPPPSSSDHQDCHIFSRDFSGTPFSTLPLGPDSSFSWR